MYDFTERTKIFAEARKKKPQKRSVRIVHEHFKVFSNAEYAERLLFSGESFMELNRIV